MTLFGFKEAGRPALQNPFFRVEMQDAIMSINTQDEILVHCRLLLHLSSSQCFVSLPRQFTGTLYSPGWSKTAKG